jgi:two-component system, sensor histidine kinase and response regulator
MAPAVASCSEAPIPFPPSRRRILIVDDLSTNRLVLQMFLEQNGFVAEQAASGEEAAELALRNSYDAILMDVHMPVVDGFAATRMIRQAETGPGRHLIVAVTASAEPWTKERCLACGMDGYFAKPLDLATFCDVLTDLIAARKTRNADEDEFLRQAVIRDGAAGQSKRIAQ